LSIQQLEGRKVSISVGVATYHGGNMPSFQDLVQQADEAMYAVKQSKKAKGLGGNLGVSSSRLK
jgi:PleD family two-component response regulator